MAVSILGTSIVIHACDQTNVLDSSGTRLPRYACQRFDTSYALHDAVSTAVGRLISFSNYDELVRSHDAGACDVSKTTSENP